MVWKEHLKNIYFDVENPISFSHATEIHNYHKKKGKLGLYVIKQWLHDFVDSYALQRPVIFKFKGNRYFTKFSCAMGLRFSPCRRLIDRKRSNTIFIDNNGIIFWFHSSILNGFE